MHVSRGREEDPDRPPDAGTEDLEGGHEYHALRVHSEVHCHLVHGDGKSVIFNSMVDNDDAFFAQMRPNCQLRVTDLGLYWYGGKYDGYHFSFNDDYPPSVVAIIVFGRMCLSEPFLPGNEDSKLQN